MGFSAGIPDYFEIKDADDFWWLIEIVLHCLDNGALAQYWTDGKKFVSKGAVRELSAAKWPDYVEMYFHSLDGLSKYELKVETYHGVGGSWEKVN